MRVSSYVLLVLLIHALLMEYTAGHSRPRHLGWQHAKVGKPYIYVLRLLSGKYYVGKSIDVVNRFQEHMEGRGSSWTALHRPIGIEEVRIMESENDENMVVKEMMLKHGWENVRGGSYSKVDLQLSDEVLQSFAAEFRGAADLCFICGNADHWVGDCPYKNARQAATLSRKEKGKKPRRGAKVKEVIKYIAGGKDASEQCCWKCGRPGHYAPDCYARRDVYGRAIEEGQVNIASYRSSSSTGIICYRCGRPGHKSTECYARRDVDGDVL